ncbi:MAG: hypothetical protein ABFC57_06225 [Veillonellales bacterium]
MNNPWMWWAIRNIGLFVLIGFAVYVTDSAWPLLGLIAVSNMRTEH